MSDSTNSSTGQQGSYIETAQSAAGILGGHAQLANGAVQEQIGNLINSEDWKNSGTNIKSSAGENIKQAFEDFKSQGNQDGQGGFVNKASSAADSACPQTGDGAGGTGNN